MMTTPMIETVRTIPLIVEKNVSVPMEAETCDSGFPFDREDRDDHFRSQLDDIAKRHPEFAEHLEGFPFRSDSLGRRRPPRPSESEFRRFPDRSFGSSRFERFGFPFTRDPFDDEFEEPKQQQQEEQPRQQQHQQEEEEERAKPGRSRKQNIQQSNTVDLGQKQEPVNERNQRSMSAPPPDNRPRYVSSINIPINRDGGMGEMGKVQSQPQQQQQQQQQQDKPVERVIPIHVEGRDEPVLPKHTGPSFSQPQSERVYGQQQPQPERIFGQRPSQFTQFVLPRQYSSGPEVRQQQRFQQQTPPPQQPKFQQEQKPQEQVPPQPQQPQQDQPPTPIIIIQSIQKDVSELMNQVERFDGAPKDKQYLYLDEMLTRNLIKLDNIDTQGQDNIRQARKEAIKCIEECIRVLETKAAANVSRGNKPEVQQTEETTKDEEMKDVDKKSEEVPVIAETKEESQPEVQETMEVGVSEVAPPVEEPKIEVQPPSEEKVEAVSKPIEEKNVPSDNKPQDEEMKEVAVSEDSKKEGDEVKEAVEEDNKESDGTSDDKDKKKGKKKVVKK